MTPDRTVVGIDPGLRGALVILPARSTVVLWADMPLMPNDKGMVKSRVDCAVLARFLMHAKPRGSVFVIIEDVQPFSNNGAVGMFSLGQSLGAVRGVAAGLGFEGVLVRPAIWKKDLALGRDKGDSLSMARRLFPTLPLSLKKHEGRAEAALLAYWYLRSVGCAVDSPVVS